MAQAGCISPMHGLGIQDGSLISSSPLQQLQGRSCSVGPARAKSLTNLPPRNKSSNALDSMEPPQAETTISVPQLAREMKESSERLGDQKAPQVSATSVGSSSTSSLTSQPSVSEEVANLSDKLIAAINRQTELEDRLAEARHDVQNSENRIDRAEKEARLDKLKLTDGSFIPRADVESEKARLLQDVEHERKQKHVVEKEKSKIEGELETLTATLFQQANEMVAAANRERDAVEKKNQQLRDQVKDTEALLANQQEQLRQLKSVMQQMSAQVERDESASSARPSAGPSSPILHTDNHEFSEQPAVADTKMASGSPQTSEQPSPAPPTTFMHMLKPVCRTDLPAYDEFQQFLLLSQQSRPSSRVTSASYNGLSSIGLSSLASSSTHLSPEGGSNSPSSVAQSGNTTVPAAQSHRSCSSPNVNGGGSPSTEKSTIPLKESRFYKRLLAEDIEPTLRIDLSPEISWLSKRGIIAALTENGLIVEPLPDRSFKLYGRSTACSLCGEARKDYSNPRTHRMRVSDDMSATNWALCSICLEKVRASCELVGYVRMVRDGVVRCGDKDDEREAWEELIRLRERLFWARMAGGVVPCSAEQPGSDHNSPTVPVVADGVRRSIDNVVKHAVQPAASNYVPSKMPERASALSGSVNNTVAAATQLNRDFDLTVPQKHTKQTSSRSEVFLPHIRDVTPRHPPSFPSTPSVAAVNSNNSDVHVHKNQRSTDSSISVASNASKATNASSASNAHTNDNSSNSNNGNGNGNSTRGGSWGSLKISVPKAFAALRDDVNVLH